MSTACTEMEGVEIDDPCPDDDNGPSPEYPVGGMVEPHDIEKDKSLIE